MFNYRTDFPELEIKVLGIGGRGATLVGHIMGSGIQGIECISISTDAQAASNIGPNIALQIGTEITQGLGAGPNTDTGRQAAQRDRDQIQQLIRGTHLLILTAGLSDGTDTGAIPVIASIAKDLGVLTVAVVTIPLSNEDEIRIKAAEEGLAELRQHVDSLIVVPTNKRFSQQRKDATRIQSLEQANETVLQIVRCLTEIITHSGLIAVDFADIRAVLSNTGTAAFGSGRATGEGRATVAATKAIEALQLKPEDLKLTKNIVCYLSAGVDFSLRECKDVVNTITSVLSPDANIVIGSSVKHTEDAQFQVSMIAAGIDNPQTGDHAINEIRKLTTRCATVSSN